MTNFLAVPKPLFTSGMTVEGYLLAYQYGNAILEQVKSNPLDRSMDSSFLDFVNDVGLSSLTHDQPLFLPITQILLMMELETMLNVDANKVVLVLERRMEPDETVLARIKHFASKGFRFALSFTGSVDAVRPFMRHMDYALILVPPEQVMGQARAFLKEYPAVTAIATDIKDKGVFDSIKYSEIKLFDGPFYKVHMATGTAHNALSPLKVNYIQLLNVVNQNDFDFATFTRTVRQDMGLAIQFMKLVNTASRSRTKIENLNQAAAMMGQREIKKWVSTAVSNALCTDSPSEITRLSLIRAKFCENLGKYFEMAMAQENLFLTGLFSVLDVVLSMSIEEALKLIFVPVKIYDALVHRTGEYADVLRFVHTYEQGMWEEVSRVALLRDIAISDIHQAYREALLWYNQLINTVVAHDDI